MKKSLFILIFVLTALLGGCASQQPEVTTEPTVINPTVTETTGAVYQPYAGSLENYSYYYADGRDLKWEEDILYTAETFLGKTSMHGHPLLVNEDFQILFAMSSSSMDYRPFYDEALRTQFLQDINELIPRITELEDEQILLALQKAIAKLGDLNTYVHFPMEQVYPIFFTAFFTDRGSELRSVMMPKEFSHLLLKKPVSINGIPIGEVIQKLMEYWSYENEYAAYSSISQFLSQPAYLEAIGITDGDSPVNFRFLDADGKKVDFTLSPMKYADLKTDDLTGYSPVSIRDKDNSRNYWWEHLEKEQALYIRFNLIEEDSNLVYSSFIQQLQQVSNVKTVIVDLRGTTGGTFHSSLSIDLGNLLNQLDGQSYVLLDASSNNTAILLSSCLRQRSTNTVLVGTPGGQPANFFASYQSQTMPNSNCGFSLSDFFWFGDENDTNDALMPDIVLNQTVADFMEGKDTVLEAILSGNLPNG